jgi:hypothetical protein
MALRRALKGLTGVLAALALAIASTTPAMADVEIPVPDNEDSGGPTTTNWDRWLPPGSCVTQPVTGTKACFQRANDSFGVYDGAVDGKSAAVYWYTSGGRKGVCYNDHGNGTWRQCDYTITEGVTVYWRACVWKVLTDENMLCGDQVASRVN